MVLISRKIITLSGERVIKEEVQEVPLIIKDNDFAIEHYHPFIEKLHRLDGPALEYRDGSKYWYCDGRLHREEGPAIETESYRAWFIEGDLHRLDGPAIEWSNGMGDYYLFHKKYTDKKEWEKAMKSLYYLEEL